MKYSEWVANEEEEIFKYTSFSAPTSNEKIEKLIECVNLKNKMVEDHDKIFKMLANQDKRM